MSRRPRFATVTAEQYRRLPTEAQMLAGLEGAAKARQGYSWHVEDTRTCPEMVNFWDTTILIPGLLVCLEVKSQHRGFESTGQEAVADMLTTVWRVVTGVVRPEPKPGEYSYDDVLRILEEW